MKKIIFPVFVAGLILSACNQKTETKEEVAYENVDFIPAVEITKKEISKDNFNVLIKSNFPDNTPLTITASREYKRQKSDEQYAIDLYYGFNAIVKNGQVSFSFNPLDRSWIDRYNKLRQEQSWDETMTEIDMKSIKDSIEIAVLYTPKGNQPENIVRIMGVDGANLSGEDVETTMGFKVYRKKMKFYNKF